MALTKVQTALTNLGVINVLDYGAKQDEKTLADGAMSASSSTLTGSGAFTIDDVGKTVKVVGAGNSGALLTSTILAFVGASQVTLATTALTTVSGARVSWRTDDTVAVNEALAFLTGEKRGVLSSSYQDIPYEAFSAFGGSWDSNHLSRILDLVGGVPGARSNITAIRETVGSGSNGPGNSDYAMVAESRKRDYLTSTVNGELDGLKANVIQGAVGDAGGILVGAYKKVGDGTIDEGGLTSMEISCHRFTSDLLTYDHLHQCIVGFSPNPLSAWSGRDAIGFYSENHAGAGFANFLGITDGNEAGVGTMQYLIAGFGERDITTKYFSVDYLGGIESTSYDTGAGSGPTWIKNRDSTSPAANDVIGEELHRGRNSDGDAVDYVRTIGTIKDATSGSEDGGIRHYTMVGGASTLQIRVENGVALGNLPTSGTGSLNLSSAIQINSATRIDSSGGIRPAVYTSVQVADITHAVNTTNKVAGKTIWDSTNNRLLSAGGSTAASTWYVGNGTVAINPA
jgi:hypothetical protein